MKIFISILMLGMMVCGLGLVGGGRDHPAAACGGLFCQNVPIDQQAEQIVFSMNGDGTISAYVQINYVGAATDFSWVVPVPSVPDVDVADMLMFRELSVFTAPQFIAPTVPSCYQRTIGTMIATPSATVTANSVEVLSAGSVGPYDFVVVDSPEPDALIRWLRENAYQVTEAMEPLIRVYNEEGMVFLAMRLQADRGTQDIQPVKMTYESELPMIPLRLTAVAARPDMMVLTWVFGDHQAYPMNYAHPTIDDGDIRVGVFQGNNYLLLLDDTVNLYEGRALVTEFAGSTATFVNQVTDPTLRDMMLKHTYLTRFIGRISPEEMTVDPMFGFDRELADVSNMHDLREFDAEVFYGCVDVPISMEYDADVVPSEWE